MKENRENNALPAKSRSLRLKSRYWILEWAVLNSLLVYNEPDNKDKAYKKAVSIFTQYFNYTIV
jgi:hypothetical protein